mmetsp:Transcript_13/g.34  ORF Transcript_13/g.34 Transcript_13/m.34 type:complete len:100 (+) Transcript_13:217-516(+)
MGSCGAFQFEVLGKVQKVSFRKYTAARAQELGLVGWVMNTAGGTVVGEAQGPTEQLAQLRTWLQWTGSPKSKITEAKFTAERSGLSRGDLGYTDFEIRR